MAGEPTYVIGPFKFLVQINFPGKGTKLDFVNNRYQVAGKRQLITEVIDRPNLRRDTKGLDTRAFDKDNKPSLLLNPVTANLKNKTGDPQKSKPGALNEFNYLQYTIVFEFDWFDRKPVMESVGGLDPNTWDRIETFISSTMDPKGAFKVAQVSKTTPVTPRSCDLVRIGNDSWVQDLDHFPAPDHPPPYEIAAYGDHDFPIGPFDPNVTYYKSAPGGDIYFWSRDYDILPPRGYSVAQLEDPGYADPGPPIPREFSEGFNAMADEDMALCGLPGRITWIPKRGYFGSEGDLPSIGLAPAHAWKIGIATGGSSFTERKLNAYDVEKDYRITPPGHYDDQVGLILDGTPFKDGRNRIAVNIYKNRIAISVNGSARQRLVRRSTFQIPRIPLGRADAKDKRNKYFTSGQRPIFQLGGSCLWRCLWLHENIADISLPGLSIVQPLPDADDKYWFEKGTGLSGSAT